MERLVKEIRRCRLLVFLIKRDDLAGLDLGHRRLYGRLITLICCLGSVILSGQDHLYIPFMNASMEGEPAHSSTPEKWFHCGPFDQSPPDLQPSFFGQQPSPEHGRSYVGMVARRNGTKESIGQHLLYELEAGDCYQLQVAMLRSGDYKSATQSEPDKVIPFITPLRMKLYGGLYYCDEWTLLDSSPVITNEKWKPYTFNFYCKKNIPSLIFEVDYDLDNAPPYNGNIMIDHCSPIIAVDCDTKMPIIKADTLAAPIIIEDWAYFLENNGAGLNQKKSLFVDANGNYQYENIAAFTILKALDKHPSKQLVIWVNPKLKAQQRDKIRTKMLQLFYHHPQLEVKAQKRKVRGVKWMYSDDLIRLGLRS